MGGGAILSGGVKIFLVTSSQLQHRVLAKNQEIIFVHMFQTLLCKDILNLRAARCVYKRIMKFYRQSISTYVYIFRITPTPYVVVCLLDLIYNEIIIKVSRESRVIFISCYRMMYFHAYFRFLSYFLVFFFIRLTNTNINFTSDLSCNYLRNLF